MVTAIGIAKRYVYCVMVNKSECVSSGPPPLIQSLTPSGRPLTPPLDLMSDESGSTLLVSESDDAASISSASCLQSPFTIPPP